MNTRIRKTGSQAAWNVVGLCVALLIGIVTFVPQDLNSAPQRSKYKRVSFGVLGLYLPGNPPPKKVLELDGREIEMLGFLAAIDKLEDMEEFIISRIPPLNCYCHPATKINEMLLVKAPGKGIDFKSGIVKIRGTLRVNKDVKSEYDGVMYELDFIELVK